MSKKIEKKEEPDEKDLSIIELARLEKNLTNKEYTKPDGSGKKYSKEVFRMWMSLPDQFKGAPERIVSLLGITDEITLELLKIQTMKAFSDEFGVKPPALSRWRKDIENNDDFLRDVKKTMRTLTKNFMGALYRRGLEEGDAQRFKIWMQVIEDWREQLGVEHSGSIETLTPEEKVALDNLLKKNT